MKPFFSVIIPTLNEEKYLPKLLKCLEKQYCQDFEVIIVDGKSHDQTLAAAKNFQEKSQKHWLLMILSVKKSNVSNQRNLGARKASGQYLVFLDADTRIPPHFFSRIREEIDINHPSFLTTWIEADSNDPQDKLIAFFGNLAFETAQFMDFSFVPGFNIIVKKSLFHLTKGFEKKIVIGEDFQLAKKIRQLGHELTILKEPKITYSLRRFRKEGTLTVLYKYTKSNLHIFLKGPIMNKLFEYEMGGQGYKKVKSKKS